MPAKHAMPPQRTVSETPPYNLQQAIERFERGYIANILELTRWNRRKTAQMLEIPPDVLAAKMREYQLLSNHIES
jgi:DNA-binding NtrC family response regulator